LEIFELGNLRRAVISFERSQAVLVSSGTDMEVSQEESMDLENQLKKARTNLRIHKRAYFSARAEAKDSDPAEKLLVVHIAKANAQEALEEVHDLEKRLGTCTARKEARRSGGAVQW
jgi:hypothetical protein